jgi:CheY-like chemotaxis protein
VESTPGKGSTFYFTLPFEEEPDSRPKTEPAVSQANAEHGDWSGKKILIVEDEESNMELLRFLLRPFHPELILAYNGEEALSRFEQTSQIDVVLLDIRLPDISGWEIAKKMKNIRPSVPVIAQTAYAMSSDQKKSRDTGCEGYITKPISKEKLYKTLSEFLSS